MQDTVVMTSGGFGGGDPRSRLYWNEDKNAGAREVGDNSQVEDVAFEQGTEGDVQFIYASFIRDVDLVS